MQERKDTLKMNDMFNEKDTFKYIKDYMFIKGFAFGKQLEQTTAALVIAKKFYEGQYRKDGLPYIIHPLKVCSMLINLGVDDDVTLAAALLHDVPENCDCGDRLPLKGEVLEIITLLKWEPGIENHELYFKTIEGNYKAALIKLCDYLYHDDTRYIFSIDKMRKHILETNKYILPMASYCENNYPEYAGVFSDFKSHIFTNNNYMCWMMDVLQNIKKIDQLNKQLKRIETKIQTSRYEEAYSLTYNAITKVCNEIIKRCFNKETHLCGGVIRLASLLQEQDEPKFQRLFDYLIYINGSNYWVEEITERDVIDRLEDLGFILEECENIWGNIFEDK